MSINSIFWTALNSISLSDIFSTGLDFAAMMSLKFGYLGSTPPAVTDRTQFDGIWTFSEPVDVCLVRETVSAISTAFIYEIHGNPSILETCWGITPEYPSVDSVPKIVISAPTFLESSLRTFAVINEFDPERESSSKTSALSGPICKACCIPFSVPIFPIEMTVTSASNFSFNCNATSIPYLSVSSKTCSSGLLTRPSEYVISKAGSGICFAQTAIFIFTILILQI